MKLEDMKEIVAPPGSVLVVSVRATMPIEQWRDLRVYLEDAGVKTGLPILLLPPEVDAHVLQLPPEEDVTDVTHLVETEPSFPEQELLWVAYNDGHIVDYRLKGGEWTAAHRIHSPIPPEIVCEGVELRWQRK